MIYIRNIYAVEEGEFDEVWAIVRNYRDPKPFIKHVPVLSPSDELYGYYCTQKNKHMWDKKNFEENFAPRFIKEMQNHESIKTMKKLIAKKDERIALVCYCQDETLCHRSIIAGLLQGCGVKISQMRKADYSVYVDMWKKYAGELPRT